jgi:lactaldehyde dehydrogenase
MLIGGEWVDADDRADVINPYDGSVVGSVPQASAAQVGEAIDAADRAFEASTLSAYERYELLTATARRLEENADEVARVLTSEQGKPIGEAETEVDRAVQTLRLSGEEGKRMFGEYVPMDAQKGFARDHCFTQHEPLGVVAAITPFNFPLNLMVHKVGPALAAGNAVVGKPATNTPFSSILLFEFLEAAAREVGAPEGLVNVVTGSGSTVGDVVLDHEAVEAISFTGSTDVGKHLAEHSGMTEITLELGGNDPTIVWDDTDVEKAAEQVVGGACSNAGQVCNSVERVIVHETIEDELIDALVDAAESLTIGDPFEDGTDIASMVDDDQFETVVDLFEQSVDAGATVECGGRYGEADGLGPRVFEPTVMSGVTPEMAVAKEETFGPLVPVIPVSDFDEAIAEANNTNYGLEAGLFTQDIDRAKRAADEIDAGGVNVNTVSGFRADHMPYGGFKDSGVGKEGIKYAVEHFSRTKLVGFHRGFNA